MLSYKKFTFSPLPNTTSLWSRQMAATPSLWKHPTSQYLPTKLSTFCWKLMSSLTTTIWLLEFTPIPLRLLSITQPRTTAVVQYNGYYIPSSPPTLPDLPYYNDTNAEVSFTSSLQSLVDENHPIEVPTNITNKMFFAISFNTFLCPNNSCEGPNGTRLATSINNISSVNPSIDILQAYYHHINGVFRTRFPDFPPLIFNFTAKYLPLYLETPKCGTKVKILDYNATVEIVFQGTNLVGGNDHPMHLHGFSFFVVGSSLGNFDKEKDPLECNLVDPPLQNTIIVPVNGWTTITFKACNPGSSHYKLLFFVFFGTYIL